MSFFCCIHLGSDLLDCLLVVECLCSRGFTALPQGDEFLLRGAGALAGCGLLRSSLPDLLQDPTILLQLEIQASKHLDTLLPRSFLITLLLYARLLLLDRLLEILYFLLQPFGALCDLLLQAGNLPLQVLGTLLVIGQALLRDGFLSLGVFHHPVSIQALLLELVNDTLCLLHIILNLPSLWKLRIVTSLSLQQLLADSVGRFNIPHAYSIMFGKFLLLALDNLSLAAFVPAII
mmetsp:Transcript_50173/g.93951  ORF Transcript_50173/g.93951 Transcript_50173/m.93951 type:complete len:234 (-) Transcript_50173:417-1118(-)